MSRTTKEKLVGEIQLQRSNGGPLASLWRRITTYLEAQDKQAVRVRGASKQQRQITDATGKVIEQI